MGFVSRARGLSVRADRSVRRLRGRVRFGSVPRIIGRGVVEPELEDAISRSAGTTLLRAVTSGSSRLGILEVSRCSRWISSGGGGERLTGFELADSDHHGATVRAARRIGVLDDGCGLRRRQKCLPVRWRSAGSTATWSVSNRGDNGTSRCFDPLPWTRIDPRSASMSSVRIARISERRTPVE